MLIKDSEKKKFEDTLTVPKFGVIFLKFSFADNQHNFISLQTMVHFPQTH